MNECIAIVNKDFHLKSDYNESIKNLIKRFLDCFPLPVIFDQTLAQFIEINIYTYDEHVDYFDDKGVFHCSGSLVDNIFYTLDDIALEIFHSQGRVLETEQDRHDLMKIKSDIEKRAKHLSAFDEKSIKLDSDVRKEQIRNLIQSLDIGLGHIGDFAYYLEELDVDPLIKAKTEIGINLLSEAFNYIDAIREEKT